VSYKVFDKSVNQMVYLAESATPEFWDKQWNGHLSNVYLCPPRHRFITWLTKKYLPLGSVILEGGCGMGDKVFALSKAGFKTVGVDFAPDTVAMINKQWPHLEVAMGDVKQLPFPDGNFDGYWSLGVIEHFIDGYSDILKEMYRVIRPEGYLFLTFPMMNLPRKWSVLRGAYPVIEGINEPNLKHIFYQYALDPLEVNRNFTEIGFSLVKSSGLSSLDCISEEFPWFRVVDNLLIKIPFGIRNYLGLLVDIILGKHFGHVALMVFKRNG
jgi:SAM-dependent methyltransferase